MDHVYKVRTLLDAGSMTNWIAKEVLKFVKHKNKGHTSMEVVTMSGTIQKNFQLVEVYFTYKGVEKTLTCYVHDSFVKHITVKGMPEFLSKEAKLPPNIFNRLVDPATDDIDHKSINDGIGMILSAAATTKIRDGPVLQNSKFNLLLEPTIFGIAVSGAVPNHLRNSVKTASSHNISVQLTEIEEIKKTLELTKFAYNQALVDIETLRKELAK